MELLLIQLQTVLGSILFLLYAITVVGLVFVIITENRNPLKTIPWVVVLLFIPGLGIAFYYFFGQDNRKQKIISKRTYKRIMKRQYQQSNDEFHDTPSQYKPLISLLENSSQANLLYGTNIEIFTNGKDKFKALIEDIKNAVHHIHFQYYIFSDDKAGAIVKDALIEKARQGVEVRVIYDDVGSWKTSKKFFKEMKDVGIVIYPYLEVAFPILTSKVNYRNHRKVVVIDGKIGYMGGMNIADRYLYGTNWGCWRDAHFRFEGKGVHGLQTAFLVDWYSVNKELINSKKYYPEAEIHNDNILQVVTSGPIGLWRTLLQAYIFTIANAKEYIYIQTPYFLPTEGLNHALQTAALGGVDVRLMLPKRSDTHLVNLASHSFIDEMVRAGVKVYFYKPGFLHSKLIVSDDFISIIGSANMDFRSFEHNFENNAFVYQKSFAKKIKALFLEDQKESDVLSPSVWLKRPLKQRWLESFMRLFSPLF